MHETLRIVESAWTQLLDAMGQAAKAARERPDCTELAAKIEMLATALQGLGIAWDPIRQLAPEEMPTSAKDVATGGYTPESSYLKPLARVLLQAGGEMSPLAAISAVEVAMQGVLLPADREQLASTRELRWENRVRWARNTLAEHGLLDRRVWGRWKLTEAGRRWVESPADKLPRPVEPDDPNQLALPF